MPILFSDPVIKAIDSRLVGITLFDYLLINGFKNAYLNDHLYPLENCIYLLFHPQEFTEKFKNLCEHLEQHKDFKTSYDVEKGVVFVFNINEKWKKDVALIKNGKYSHTSVAFKALFPQTVRNSRGQKVLFKNWMILHKHPQFKKEQEEKFACEISSNAELWDIFSPKSEILNYNEEFVDLSW